MMNKHDNSAAISKREKLGQISSPVFSQTLENRSEVSQIAGGGRPVSRMTFRLALAALLAAASTFRHNER